MGVEQTIDDHAIVLAYTDGIDRIDWLDERRKGIGGSDAAAVLGLSPWRSPYSVWADKTGYTDHDETPNMRMRCGQLLEPVIGQLFYEETGIEVSRWPVILRSKDWPWMIVNLDFVADSPEAVLEAKTSDARFGGKWEDDDGNAQVPPMYSIQGQHECAVTGLRRVYFGVLIGGNDFRIIEVKRDDDLIESLVEGERKFWDLVERVEAPAVDGSDSTTKALKALYPESVEGEKAYLPESASETIQRLTLAKAKKAAYEEEVHLYENQLKAQMGTAEYGYLDERLVVTWKSSTVREHVRKESIRRPLMLK